MATRQIFRKDGLLKGVTFRRRTQWQSALIAVQLYGETKLQTSFKIDEGVNFDMQYLRVVETLAEFYGLEYDDPIRGAMQATKEAFLEHHGLKTRTVSYQVIIFD